MKKRHLILLSLAATLLSGCANGYKQFYTVNPHTNLEAIAKNRAAPTPPKPRAVKTAPAAIAPKATTPVAKPIAKAKVNPKSKPVTASAKIKAKKASK